jgi:hypothetical protein
VNGACQGTKLRRISKSRVWRRTGLGYVLRAMTREEHERLYALVQNPPPGSKIEAAKEYGVDLTLNLRRLLLTPTERAREMEGALIRGTAAGSGCTN